MRDCRPGGMRTGHRPRSEFLPAWIFRTRSDPVARMQARTSRISSSRMTSPRPGVPLAVPVQRLPVADVAVSGAAVGERRRWPEQDDRQQGAHHATSTHVFMPDA